MIESLVSPIFARELLIFISFSVILVLCSEIGCRMGIATSQKNDEAFSSLISSYSGVVFGLLALLLGFTFSLAGSRYEMRRNLLVQQANSIGTTYLRTSFLPEESRRISRSLIRDFVDLLIKYENSNSILLPTEKQAAYIQAALWHQVELAGAQNSSPLMASYVTSLNDTIDSESTRSAASRATIPGAIWVILAVVSIVTFWSTGYSSGIAGKRSFFLLMGLPVLIAVVMSLIYDLNRPHKGFIRTDYTSLMELRSSMN